MMLLGPCLLQLFPAPNHFHHEGLSFSFGVLLVTDYFISLCLGFFYSPLTSKSMVIFGACIWLGNHPKLKLVTDLLTITHQCHHWRSNLVSSWILVGQLIHNEWKSRLKWHSAYRDEIKDLCLSMAGTRLESQRFSRTVLFGCRFWFIYAPVIGNDKFLKLSVA